MKRRLLAFILVLAMAFTMLPAAALAAEEDTTLNNAVDNGIALFGASQLVDGTTNYVYGGCMIVFTQNTDNTSTYTATVRALTPEEASQYKVDTNDIGNLGANASPNNQWDGNGDWQPADRGPFTPAPYWETYKDITTKVVIQSGVKQLNGAAFTRFDKVTSLVWEDTPTVTTIGNNFLMSSSIDELTIPSSVTKIGGYAFGKYHDTGTAPTQVILENPNVTCSTSAFAYQDTANVLIVVDTEDDISNLLAYAKTSGYQVKNLKDYAEDMTGEISWTYSAGTLTLKGSGAMQDFTTTEAVPWKNYMTKITEVSIADGITSIGANAFNGASKLTGIQLPKSVTSIGASAFANSGLTDKVRIPATVTSIGANAFQNVSATIYIYNGIWNNDGETNLIDDTQIGTGKVVHFIYGANIGGSTYPRSTNVMLGVDANGTAYVDAYNNGVVSGFNFDGGYHYIEVAPPNDESKTSNKSVVSPLFYTNTTVWPHSADVNKRVKKAVIGDNVTGLYSGLFAYCTNLTEVEFAGDDLTVLGGNVFMGTSIENIDLPATVNSVGSYAFGQYSGKGKNPSLITLRYNGTIRFSDRTDESDGESFFKTIFCSTEPQVPQNIILYAHGTTNAKAYAESVGYTFVDLDAAGGQIGDTDTYWTIQNGDTLFIYGTGSTGDFAADAEKPWKDVTGITAIKVAASVDTIGSYLFAGMSDVNSVTIGNGVTTIKDHAFYDLTSLHRVALPSSVETVGEYAFALSTASEDDFALSIGNANANVAKNATDNRNATTDKSIASGNCGVGSGGSYQNNVTYTLDEDGKMTLTGTGEMGTFNRDGQYQPWAGLRDKIKKVVYNEGIITTGQGAFAYCKDLESVKLPQNSLTTLSNNTFMDAGVVAFDNLTIPATVTSIGDYAFGYYNSNTNAKITGITLGNPEATFLTHSFNGKSDILNSTVTIYVHNQGKNCAVKTKAAEYGYKYIDLDVYSSEKLTGNNLKYELYEGVLTLTAIDPEKEATIPTPQPWADKAGTITKIVIGAGVRNIPDGAFEDYTALTEIELPQTLVSIGANAFATTNGNDTALTVTMPKSVTSLDDSAFANRSNVKMTSYANTAGERFTADGVTNNVKKEFKVLLIGNSYSEDASDWTDNGTVSHSYEVYKSLMGDNVELTIGLMASGGKVLAWHATNAYNNTAAYTLRLTGEDGKWTSVGTVKTIKDALAYEEWDVVSLQPYGKETTDGIAGNNTYNPETGADYRFDATRFGTLAQSIPYFLDLTENYVPHAQVYYYMHLSEHGTGNYADGLNSTKDTYEERAAMAQTVKNYTGTTYTGKKLTDVIPVGTAIQNARTTYLTKLSNADASATVNLANDPVFGLQRDGGHLTYNVGRYIAALTFAEKIIPSVYRNNAAADCGMRDSQSVGKLPAQYAEIARKAVAAAITTPYKVTPINGYVDDPIEAIKVTAEGTYAENDWASDDAFKAAVEKKLSADYADAKVESVNIADGKATVMLRYGYSTTTAEITYSSDAVMQAWTAYIDSTDLGHITVPGSDMVYSQVPDINAAIVKGYSDIDVATTASAAATALDNSKSALLAAVKDYVNFLAEKVYNNGEAIKLNGKVYMVSANDYTTAVSAIDSAAEVADVLDAYKDMLANQVVKTIAEVTIMPNPATMRGAGSVKLTVTAPEGTEVTVTCDDPEIKVLPNPDDNNTYTVALPNKTKTYIFTAESAENAEYTTGKEECKVEVTRRSSGSSSSTSYDVSAPSTSNGTVTVSPKNAKAGDTETNTVTPDSGYEIDTVTVKDANGNKLKLTDKGNGKYTFTMPAGKVTVSASFNAASAEQTFEDVPSSAYYAKAVAWAVKNGITDGIGNNLFGSNAPCTRGQIVTFLWRAAGSPEPKNAGSSFSDVSADSYYAKAVAWAVENGITDGTGDGKFSPDATCNRGQSVTFLCRALKGSASGKVAFTDVPANAFYTEAVAWAVASNVTNGTSDTTFAPNADCTRAEIVTFLYRAYQGK